MSESPNTPQPFRAAHHPHEGDPVFDLHVGGKMGISSTPLTGKEDLSLAYTPGVALVCEAIAADPAMTQHYTWVPNTVAGRRKRDRKIRIHLVWQANAPLRGNHQTEADRQL